MRFFLSTLLLTLLLFPLPPTPPFLSLPSPPLLLCWDVSFYFVFV